MKIVNAKVFTPEFIFKDGEICVDKEQFAAVSPDASKIDAKGLYALNEEYKARVYSAPSLVLD